MHFFEAFVLICVMFLTTLSGVIGTELNNI